MADSRSLIDHIWERWPGRITKFEAEGPSAMRTDWKVKVSWQFANGAAWKEATGATVNEAFFNCFQNARAEPIAGVYV